MCKNSRGETDNKKTKQKDNARTQKNRPCAFLVPLGMIDQFNASEGFNTIILSPKAAGVGLNITSANHVIHYTREWNPAIESQATDRIYRIGQKKDVKVYYPIVRYGNDGIIVEEKQDLPLNKKMRCKHE